RLCARLYGLKRAPLANQTRRLEPAARETDRTMGYVGELFKGLQDGYQSDDLASKVRKKQPEAILLRYNDKLYVPQGCIKKKIRDHHDDPINGHPGVTKTIEL
ncbi:MAG: hypothetical protein M1826_000324, partial [Phylliscum demangeonii]